MPNATESTTERSAALTVEDIDQIAEGIDHFIIGTVDPDPEVARIWQPYIDQLKAQRSVLAASSEMLQALREVEGACYALDASFEDRDSGNDAPHCAFCGHTEGKPHDPDCTMTFVLAAIALAVGRA